MVGYWIIVLRVMSLMFIEGDFVWIVWFFIVIYVIYVIIGLNEKLLDNDRNIFIFLNEFLMFYIMIFKSDVLNLNVVF